MATVSGVLWLIDGGVWERLLNVSDLGFDVFNYCCVFETLKLTVARWAVCLTGHDFLVGHARVVPFAEEECVRSLECQLCKELFKFRSSF